MTAAGQDFNFGSLRRYPDVEAPNLTAADATDRLLLDLAAPYLQRTPPGRVAVIGDRFGALTLGAAWLYGQREIRVHQDLRTSALALENNAASVGLAACYSPAELGAGLLAGAEVVLLQLPRSLDELEEVSAAVARHADPGVVLLAGGRLKHMTHGMNRVLERHFGVVTASLARQKSRVLTATEPMAPISAMATGAAGSTSSPVTGPDAPGSTAGPGADAFPRRKYHPELGLWLCAHGAVFAGNEVDLGTRFLLGFLEQAAPAARRAVDLGCGSGLIAAFLASTRPELEVTATDQSAAAVASAAATAAANGLSCRVTAVHDDAMSGFPDASAELVVLNPPFHLGAAVHAGAALKLFDAAGRVLAPGGELWTVYNRHLDYAAALERGIGRTRIVGTNKKFTVACSVRRP